MNIPNLDVDNEIIRLAFFGVHQSWVWEFAEKDISEI